MCILYTWCYHVCPKLSNNKYISKLFWNSDIRQFIRPLKQYQLDIIKQLNHLISLNTCYRGYSIHCLWTECVGSLTIFLQIYIVKIFNYRLGLIERLQAGYGILIDRFRFHACTCTGTCTCNYGIPRHHLLWWRHNAHVSLHISMNAKLVARLVSLSISQAISMSIASILTNEHMIIKVSFWYVLWCYIVYFKECFDIKLIVMTIIPWITKGTQVTSSHFIIGG